MKVVTGVSRYVCLGKLAKELTVIAKIFGKIGDIRLILPHWYTNSWKEGYNDLGVDVYRRCGAIIDGKMNE